MRQSYEAAVELLTSKAERLPCEYVPINLANGRVLAEDVFSKMNVPPFDRSPLDGYAVKAEDIKGAASDTPVRLKVVDGVNAGGYLDITVNKGEAVRIMTGAAIPRGCDCVVAQENTDYGEDTVSIFISHKKHENYCFEGEDIKSGECVAKSGTAIRYAHQGVLASIGVRTVSVVKKPVIALFVTGDELSPIDNELAKGKIYNSNLYLIASRMEELGVSAEITDTVSDDCGLLAEKIKEAATKADVIITTGGVSVGKKDILHETLNMLNAESIFKGVDFKPGSPAIFSMYNNTPILSLSGNPFAAIATFELFGRPLLHKMTENPALSLKRVKAEVKEGFNKKSGTRRFVRAKFENGGVIIPQSGKTDRHSSGVIASLVDCNCLVDIEAGSAGINVGDTVNVILL